MHFWPIKGQELKSVGVGKNFLEKREKGACVFRWSSESLGLLGLVFFGHLNRGKRGGVKFELLVLGIFQFEFIGEREVPRAPLGTLVKFCFEA